MDIGEEKAEPVERALALRRRSGRAGGHRLARHDCTTQFFYPAALEQIDGGHIRIRGQIQFSDDTGSMSPPCKGWTIVIPRASRLLLRRISASRLEQFSTLQTALKSWLHMEYKQVYQVII